MERGSSKHSPRADDALVAGLAGQLGPGGSNREEWAEERKRLENLGSNGPRDVEGHPMTHCVPNARSRQVETASA